MGSQVFDLAILISARDLASGTLDRASDRLRGLGREGRGALRDLTDLRQQMSRGLTFGGIGVAGLTLLAKGVGIAGDFQAASTDLKTAITELGAGGSVNVAKLNDQMNRLDSLGSKLGSTLPGSSTQFLEMFAVLKQGGLDTETIINGAGEAVAKLAITSKQVPKNLAEPLAAFGMQFDLKGKDYIRLADLFARAGAATGVSPQELVESSKYFQLRAGTTLGMTGLEGAEATTQMLSMLARKGLRGSEAGTGLAGLFSRLRPTTDTQQSILADLRKQGIDLQFFDKKDRFLGVENTIAQLAKLQQLTPGKRIETLKGLFGEEAMGAASLLSQAGIDGLKQSNEELKRKLSLDQQAVETTSTLNAKLENLTGTLQTLAVTGFEPLIEPLSKTVDLLNKGAGALQSFAEAHPAGTKTVAYMLAIGSAVLTAAGAIKVLRSGWGLLRIASAVGQNESGIISFLTRTRTEAATTAQTLQTTATSARAATTALAGSRQIQLPFAENMRGTSASQGLLPFMHQTSDASNSAAAAMNRASRSSTMMGTAFERVRGGVRNLSSSVGSLTSGLKGVGVSLGIITAATAVLSGLDEQFYRPERDRAQREGAMDLYEDFQEREAERRKAGEFTPQREIRSLARGAFKNMNSDRQLELTLTPERFDAITRLQRTDRRYNSLLSFQRFDPQLAGAHFKSQMPELQNPQVMRGVIQEFSKLKASAGALEQFLKALEIAQPESYRQAMKMSADEITQLNQQTTPLTQSFQQLQNPLAILPENFARVGSSAESLSGRLRNINPTFNFTLPMQNQNKWLPTPNVGQPPFQLNQLNPLFRPSSYRGERIEQIRPIASNARRQRSGNLSVRQLTVHIPAGSAAANDPTAFFDHLGHRLERERERGGDA